MTFGETFHVMRKQRGLTQYAIAQRCRPRMTPGYISRIERGIRRPSVESLDKIADAMALDDDERNILMTSAGFTKEVYRHDDMRRKDAEIRFLKRRIRELEDQL